MIQAIVASGFMADAVFDEDKDCVTIGFKRDASVHRDGGCELYQSIFRRQCTKHAFDGNPLRPEVLDRIRASVADSDVPTVLLLSDEAKRMVAKFVARGNAVQLSNPAFRNELLSWIRPNDQVSLETRDGLAGRTLGAPSVPTWLFPFVARFVISAERQSRIDTNNIMSSAGVAVFVCTSESKAGWVAVGRAYERFALVTTAMDVRTAFINQPIEVPSLRRELEEWLEIRKGTASLVVRFGYGRQAPFSLRRSTAEVLGPAAKFLPSRGPKTHSGPFVDRAPL